MQNKKSIINKVKVGCPEYEERERRKATDKYMFREFLKSLVNTCIIAEKTRPKFFEDVKKVSERDWKQYVSNWNNNPLRTIKLRETDFIEMLNYATKK